LFVKPFLAAAGLITSRKNDCLAPCVGKGDAHTSDYGMQDIML
jgi:hypothetical protein